MANRLGRQTYVTQNLLYSTVHQARGRSWRRRTATVDNVLSFLEMWAMFACMYDQEFISGYRINSMRLATKCNNDYGQGGTSHMGGRDTVYCLCFSLLVSIVTAYAQRLCSDCSERLDKSYKEETLLHGGNEDRPGSRDLFRNPTNKQS